MASGTTINRSGNVFVDGGVADGIVANGGFVAVAGELDLDTAPVTVLEATASDVTLNDGSVEEVDFAGVANGTIVNSGCGLSIFGGVSVPAYSGGFASAVNNTLNSGGDEYVGGWGFAIGTTG